jgi:hypothetical protein
MGKMEDKIDNNEAESSFKDILDWMQYLAQHKGQLSSLLNLMSVVAAGL